ncbi:MAG: lamin tail domain-containing protein, partial [Verrucomicrobia bacterium]|nr:lamin tail domain-containing protein [Verrucomicrobiota bacterium]
MTHNSANTGIRLVVRVAMLVLAAQCASAQVIINELMYHPYEPWPSTQPAKTVSLTEYVEIYNKGDATADLSLYRFENGISFNFPAGAQLAPGAYGVICEDYVAFTNAYPTATNRLFGVYSGSLRNSGERITLSRLTAGDWITEDTLAYIDDNGSDGTGYSLELVNPGLYRPRNQFAGDWLTSLTVSGTPGVVNSRFDPAPKPIVGDVSHFPALPPANSMVTIQARVSGRDGDAMDSVLLKYRKSEVVEGAFKDVPMYDDGLNGGDLVAGDGIYTTVIPTNGSATVMNNNDIVEFKIAGTDITGTRTFPIT